VKSSSGHTTPGERFDLEFLISFSSSQEMPIIDGELIGEGVDNNFVVPDVPLGIYIEDSIRKNVTQYGDCNWLVIMRLDFKLE
jgi:hypothetical protein